MLSYTFSATLETTTGFVLNTDKLNTGVLGYVETALDAEIRSASWQRGRGSVFDNFTAGSCQVVFDNRDRLLDPKNTSSPLYGELRPGRAFTLYMTYSGMTLPVFSGFVESWVYGYTMSGDATVTVTVLDAFSYLNNKIISSIVAPAEASGTRVSRVLDSVGWPVSKRSIDTGYSTLAAETISNVSALQYLTSVAQSEFGLLFADAEGVLQFKQRNRVFDMSAVKIQNTANSSDSYIEDVVFDYSFDRIINKVTLTNSALPATATASDSSSISLYGERPESFDVLISSSTQMQSIASGISVLYSVPDFIARQVSFNIENIPFSMVNQRTIDVGYLTSVYWLPPGTVGTTDPISIPALLITGVKYDAVPGSINVTLELDYALGYDSFILNDTVKGVLNTGKLGV